MTITVSYEARCSFCTATYGMGRINIDVYPITKSNFITQLRAKGWSIGKHTTCPGCKEENLHKRMRLKYPKKRHYDTPSSIALSRQDAQP